MTPGAVLFDFDGVLPDSRLAITAYRARYREAGLLASLGL